MQVFPVRDFRDYNIFSGLPLLTDAELGQILAQAFAYTRKHAKECSETITHAHDFTVYDCDRIAAEIIRRGNS